MRVEEIRFNFGKNPGAEPLIHNPKNITVFIGPNNGGKSQALREIRSRFISAEVAEFKIFSEVVRSHIGQEEFEAKRSKIIADKRPGDEMHSDYEIYWWRGRRQQVHLPSLKSYFEQGTVGDRHVSDAFLSYFSLNLSGDTRLQLVNAVNSTDIREKPGSTAAALLKNDDLRKKLSDVVYAAFGMYLVIDPIAMAQLHYALSPAAPPSPELERSLSEEAVEFFSKTQKLADASDGTKAFVGILSEVIAGDPETIFIDEPEAFLHPGLAYMLGKEIGKNISSDKQLFVATHSPQFLMGCIASGVDIDIIRLTYNNNVGTARLLPAEKLKVMMNDPLLRSIGVISALFYNSTVLVEGPSDRAFYEEINGRLEAAQKPHINHALFLQTHGKHAAAEISLPLREIGIPTAMILDVDWIKEGGTVEKKYFLGAGIPDGLHNSLGGLRRDVRTLLEAKNTNYKRHGGFDLLEEEDKKVAAHLADTMDKYGLFTMRKGEVEAWLAHLGCSKNKSVWLFEMFKALGSDATDPAYVKPGDNDVWKFLQAVASWLNNPNRDGML